MTNDGNLGKRNSLVILGGLMAFYSFVFILWAAFWRSLDIAIHPVVWVVVVFGLVLGTLLLVLGFVLFPFPKGRKTEEWLYHGTGVHFTFALLLSLVLISIGWYIGATISEANRNDEWIAFETLDGIGIRVATVALWCFGVALAALIPFWALLGNFARIRTRTIADLEDERDRWQKKAQK